MIDVKKIDAHWFEKTRQDINSDPILLEKVVKAFLLVEGLLKSDLKFIFKGIIDNFSYPNPLIIRHTKGYL